MLYRSTHCCISLLLGNQLVLLISRHPDNSSPTAHDYILAALSWCLHQQLYLYLYHTCMIKCHFQIGRRTIPQLSKSILSSPLTTHWYQLLSSHNHEKKTFSFLLNGFLDTVFAIYLPRRKPNHGHPRKTIMDMHCGKGKEADLGLSYCTVEGCQ